MRRTTTAMALAGAVAAASGAYAVGTQVNDGSAAATTRGTVPATATGTQPVSATTSRGRGGRGPDGRLGDLATRLGVTQAQLRAALDEVRPQRHDPARRAALASALAGAIGGGVTAGDVTKALDALRAQHDPAKALADKLGIAPSKVRSALDALRQDGRRGFGHGVRGGLAAALAGKLGIDTDQVRTALQQLRDEHRGDRGARRDRGTALADALAKQLNVDAARVRAALDKLRQSAAADAQARRDAFVKALAAQLKLPEQKVRDALAAGGPFRGRGPGRFGGHRGGPWGPPGP